jgi:hypothetical protein
MKSTTIPACSRCTSGKVELVQISMDDSGVFKPQPEGWNELAYTFLCQCGWYRPLTKLEVAELKE